MIQPLNYSPKAISDLLRLADGAAPHSRKGFLFLADLLRRAEVFVLPEGGELLQRDKPRPEVTGTIYRPPFPVVALEYNTSEARWLADDEVRCPRRISLAWQWDGKLPCGPADPSVPVAGEGVFIASISYFENERMWLPVMAAMMIPFDATYGKTPPRDFQQTMIESGRIPKRHLETPRIQVSETMILLPEAFVGLARSAGEAAALDLVARDLMDEINSYADLCLSLACNNVSSERRTQPEKLNRARIKAGKLPLKDFHVLQIAGHGQAEGFGGDHGGMRSHLRRGHIRRLGPERITWVNATMVRGSRPGFVDKHYALQGIS